MYPRCVEAGRNANALGEWRRRPRWSAPTESVPRMKDERGCPEGQRLHQREDENRGRGRLPAGRREADGRRTPARAAGPGRSRTCPPVLSRRRGVQVGAPVVEDGEPGSSPDRTPARRSLDRSSFSSPPCSRAVEQAPVHRRPANGEVRQGEVPLVSGAWRARAIAMPDPAQYKTGDARTSPTSCSRREACGGVRFGPPATTTPSSAMTS